MRSSVIMSNQRVFTVYIILSTAVKSLQISYPFLLRLFSTFKSAYAKGNNNFITIYFDHFVLADSIWSSNGTNVQLIKFLHSFCMSVFSYSLRKYSLNFALRKDIRLSRKTHNRIDNMQSQYSRDLTSDVPSRAVDRRSVTLLYRGLMLLWFPPVYAFYSKSSDFNDTNEVLTTSTFFYTVWYLHRL